MHGNHTVTKVFILVVIIKSSSSNSTQIQKNIFEKIRFLVLFKKLMQIAALILSPATRNVQVWQQSCGSDLQSFGSNHFGPTPCKRLAGLLDSQANIIPLQCISLWCVPVHHSQLLFPTFLWSSMYCNYVSSHSSVQYCTIQLISRKLPRRIFSSKLTFKLLPATSAEE